MIQIAFATTIIGPYLHMFESLSTVHSNFAERCVSHLWHGQVLSVRVVPIPDALLLQSSSNIALSGFSGFL